MWRINSGRLGNMIKKLRVLLPGCPFEKALDKRKEHAESMSAGLAEIVEATESLRVDLRKNPDITRSWNERRTAHIR